MARKQSKLSTRMLFVWCSLIGMILLIAPSTLTGKLRFGFARLFQRPLGISRSISLAAEPDPDARTVSREKYEQLHNYLANVSQQLQQSRDKLEKVSGMRQRLGLEGAGLVHADIVRASIDGLHSRLYINRGSADGLGKGQYVLGNNSVIGKVSDVSAHHAQVRLITDPASKIPVRIGRMQGGWVMRGKGNGTAGIGLVPVKYDIEQGDKVYVQQDAGRLGQPIIAGTVSSLQRDEKSAVVWKMEVTPACRLDSLEGVGIVIMKQ